MSFNQYQKISQKLYQMDDEIVVVNQRSLGNVIRRDNKIIYSNSILIAPSKPVETLQEMNDFQYQLSQSIEMKIIASSLSRHRNKSIELGFLDFEEVIGVEKRTQVLELEISGDPTNNGGRYYTPLGNKDAFRRIKENLGYTDKENSNENTNEIPFIDTTRIHIFPSRNVYELSSNDIRFAEVRDKYEIPSNDLDEFKTSFDKFRSFVNNYFL